MTCADAARLGHEKRREPIRCKAAAMRAAMNMPPHPGLALVLTTSDRVN